MKARVTLVTSLTSDNPYYMVEYFVPTLNDWSTAKIFSFKYNESEDSVWNQESNLKQAMELAKRFEEYPERSETLIYQTPENETGDSK
jgi:hypothetical protein